MDGHPGREPASPAIPRFYERLLAAVDHDRLVLIAAPAGSDQMTLLSAWLATRPITAPPAAWVSLDEGDNDPARFWRYVGAALLDTIPAAGYDAAGR